MIRSLRQRLQWPRKGDSIKFDIKSFRCWMIRPFLDFYKKSRNGEKIIDLDNPVLDWGSTSLSCYWERAFPVTVFGSDQDFQGMTK